jgi:hypothetical protein
VIQNLLLKKFIAWRWEKAGLTLLYLPQAEFEAKRKENAIRRAQLKQQKVRW